MRSFKFRICLQYLFHSLLNGDNLQVDSPVIRKIRGIVFMCSAKNDNLEPGLLTRNLLMMLRFSKFLEDFKL